MPQSGPHQRWRAKTEKRLEMCLSSSAREQQVAPQSPSFGSYEAVRSCIDITRLIGQEITPKRLNRHSLRQPLTVFTNGYDTESIQFY